MALFSTKELYREARWTCHPGHVVLCRPRRGQTAEQKRATIAYLQGLQAADGGFVPGQAKPPSTLRSTSSALRALQHFGGEPRPDGVRPVRGELLRQGDRRLRGSARGHARRDQHGHRGHGRCGTEAAARALRRACQPVPGQHARTF